MTTLRLTDSLHLELHNHLFPRDGLEAVALLICGRHEDSERGVLTARKVVPIPYEECSVRRDDLVVWSTDSLDRIVAEVWNTGASIVKVHSHPGGYTKFSEVDDRSDRELSLAFDCLFTEGRLHASAIMLPSGRMFGRELICAKIGEPLSSVLVAGENIDFWPNQVCESERPDDRRNLQAFGSGTISLLSSLRVAVIGCSGTGSVVIEQLARLGVGSFVLVDPDLIEEKNLNRILNSTAEDAREGTPKVRVMERMIHSLGRGQNVLALQQNLDSAEAVRRVCECDIIFGCVDGAEGRNLANRIAAYYLQAYIDVGVSLVADGVGGIDGIAGAVHYYSPGSSSLLDRGAFTLEQVRAEETKRTNPDGYAELKRQKYILGVDEERPAVISVNTLFAALAVMEFLARVHRFRNIHNREFSTVRGDLCESVLFREPEIGIQAHLKRELGLGDQVPLLGRVSLSEGS